MFTFIDTKTGNAFNGDRPYIFWFENGQSINLNYVLKICCYSDKDHLTIECNSSVFSILKMDQLIPSHQRIVMNQKEYIDLEDLKTNSYTVDGYRYHGNYVYLFYIMANSRDSGEYIETFTIDGVEYSVGADFYPINEILQSNLENFEIKFPESIQRAIYEENLHEESNDNIVLNRKYKELLMNYWDIVANKGSYESLTNSLLWFEWDDLVRIEEVWKNAEPHQDVYKLKGINSQLDAYLKSQLQNLSKTTYIGLYYALHKIETDSHGHVVYEDTYNNDPQLTVNAIHSNERVHTMNGEFEIRGLDTADVIQTSSRLIGRDDTNLPNRFYNEEIPQLQHVVALWNNLDLCLKMTLLGNFYQTYFMPVHMDLIHSTIESWSFSYAMKLMNNTEISRLDYFDNTRTFDLDYSYESGSSYGIIKPIKTYTYQDTLFKGPIGSVVSGVNLEVREFDQSTASRDSMLFLRNLFNAECSIVNFHGQISSQCSIYRERITWSRNGEVEGQIDDTTELPSVDDIIDFKFSLRFLESGEYKLYFEFYGLDSHVYTKTLNITIQDNVRNTLKLYKVVRAAVPDMMSSEDLYNILSIKGLSFQLSGRDYTSKCSMMTQFLFCDKGIDYNSCIGLTHTLSIPLRGVQGQDYIEYMGQTYDLDINGANTLINNPPSDYWCYIVDRPVDGISPTEPTLLCIRKTFEMNNTMRVESNSGSLTHIVDEFRFYPIFHELEPLDNSMPISHNDIIFVDPIIKHSKNINKCNWEFRNVSTLKSTYSELHFENDYPDGRYMGDHGEWLHGGTQGIIHAAEQPVLLEVGYYNIILHYKEGETEQEIALDSAFLLEK